MRNKKLLGLLLVIVAVGMGFVVYFIVKDQWGGDDKKESQLPTHESKKSNDEDDKKIEKSKKEIDSMNDKSNEEKKKSDEDDAEQGSNSNKEDSHNLDKRTEFFIDNMFTNLNQENYNHIKNRLSTICTPHFMHKYFKDKDSQYNFYMDVNISGFETYESRKPQTNGKTIFATFERSTSPAHSGNNNSIKPSHEQMTVAVIYKKVNGKMLVNDFKIQSNEDLDSSDDSEDMD
ncbi:hypothetical protein K4Q45_09725 [Staphylococcus epidermidis]|nr:hypothetical protein [Staphylococcus epidermidis]MCG1734841.1 hypothetical protein [Staphylococcus epidermidis]MCG1741470.1 hypothetical protein [Staphylococcus epidermidis]MCG1743945.1 hypothetical protein [Staphylococcus epidermidis]